MVSVIIMAGGLGKRMNSHLPKVLHKVGPYPMLVHVVKTALSLDVNKIIIIVGKFKELIQEVVSHYISSPKISYVIQHEPLGTGHAIQCAVPELVGLNENIIILSGDTPLISKESLISLIHQNSDGLCSLLVKMTENPFGLGRIIMKDSYFDRIVEEKDASYDEKQITLVNCGIYIIHSELIINNIFKLGNSNSQGEYYLTDLLTIIKDNKTCINLCYLDKEKEFELTGINNQEELNKLNYLIYNK